MSMFSPHIFYGDDEIIAYCISCLSGTSTNSSCCPDFLLWLGDLLVFWGEEKAVSGAKADLEKKANKIDPTFFGEIQFMICYAANGHRIRFYAYDGSPEGLKRPDP